MAGKFPQANNVEQFWENIASAKDCIVEIPKHRWDIDAYYDSDSKRPGSTNCRRMGALDEYDRFDPLFFNISPRDAEFMDPQQRLFLEACWHSIEDAGVNPLSLSGSKCGVFAGGAMCDYSLLMQDSSLTAQGFMGGAPSIIAARISYFLNLQGPCLSIDTACSSSLVAIANACDSLVAGNSDSALAGGVYVMAGPSMHIMTTKAGMLSPDGKCFSFDQRANGFVPGEGVGVIFLKRLEDALRDNNPVYGIIKGWGVNQDGKTNGITAPNPDSQTRLQKGVYEKFQINPEEIQLIETHGTGTKLGDPIEVEGLINAFKPYTQQTNYCALGAIKSNVGHSLAAAGVSGVIKLLLSLKHKKFPPSINFEKLNEHIVLEESPFYVNTESKDWDTPEKGVRYAAINSFGFSGTNAHVVISEPEAKISSSDFSTSVNIPVVLTLSAQTQSQLNDYAQSLACFINRSSDLSLSCLAYTFQIGRQPMDYRLAVVANTFEELKLSLQSYIEVKPDSNVFSDKINQASERITDNEEGKEYIEKLIQNHKYKTLAALWVKGNPVDWKLLYREGSGNLKNVKTLSGLPAYPFARERYWIPETNISTQTSVQSATAAYLHPLVHENDSDQFALSYHSTFSGKEFFLADHAINGEHLLPAVAYLEMARFAGTLGSRKQVIALENVVWLDSVKVLNQPKRVTIQLTPKDKHYLYKVLTLDEEETQKPKIHFQGRAIFSDSLEKIKLKTIDITEIQSRCTWVKNSKELNAIISLVYGDSETADNGVNSFQVMKDLRYNEKEALATLRLPNYTEERDADYLLHPGIMNGALQAAQHWYFLQTGDTAIQFPFVLEELSIYNALSEWAYVYVTYSPNARTQTSMTKYHIDIVNSAGEILVSFKGLTIGSTRANANKTSVSKKKCLSLRTMIKMIVY